MPTIYLTKVWGFEVPVGPLQFSAEGWRKRAQETLQPGDLVVLAGTKNDRTSELHQGRLLGMMEPTSEPVRALDFELRCRPEDYDENHQYRWQFGLKNVRAWRFTDMPPISEIADRDFGMGAVKGIVRLTTDETDKILKLSREDVPLLKPTASAHARTVGADAARKRGAPPPSTTRNGVMHLRRAPAYTYVMEVVGSQTATFKIGWAFDYERRARQFNQYAMPELGGLRYKPVLSQLWDTARQAYRMEQRLLEHFRSLRHMANQEIVQGVGRTEMESAWTRLITDKA